MALRKLSESPENEHHRVGISTGCDELVFIDGCGFPLDGKVHTYAELKTYAEKMIDITEKLRANRWSLAISSGKLLNQSKKEASNERVRPTILLPGQPMLIGALLAAIALINLI
jgi:hypothetical protein